MPNNLIESVRNYFGKKNNVKVIVGHYVGGSISANITDELRNANNYKPVTSAGEDGKPVQLLARELIKARELYTLHGYNIVVGDRIPINRTLPDIRSQSCSERSYVLDSLPTASVVIVFHNEAWSTLLRTVLSVLTRSPAQLLREIILVDDASERTYLGRSLDEYIAQLGGGGGRVKLLRLRSRSGLVAARLEGARNAVGAALVFLDAHCEVTTGWLEPLLDQAGSDDVFVCPHIDLISDDTFAYIKSNDMHWGAFSRRLHFRWITPSTKVLRDRMKDPSRPYPTPAMAGGLFAVRKSLFWRLGGYDEGMKVWGGENFELSWRAWQCGARVEIAPCSRVGHVFRKHTPYTFPGGVAGTLYNNLARAVIVWMDQWADFYFKFNPYADKNREKYDVEKRIEIRKNLNCKSFDWYLRNVWPEHYFPADDRWFGRVKNSKGACLGVDNNTDDRPRLSGAAFGMRCGDDLQLETMIVMTREGWLMADEGLCLEAVGRNVGWKGCSGSEKQRWKQKGPRLKTLSGECLTLATADESSRAGTSGVGALLLTQPCGDSDEQVWVFERVPWR